MLVKNQEVDRIEEIITENDLFSKYNLQRIGIFGSVARGEKSNDIDILIEEDINYLCLSDLRDELQRLLNKRVDIVIAKYSNPIVLYRAKKEIVYVAKY